MLTTLFSRGDISPKREPISRQNEDLVDSTIVRNQAVETVASETDLFERARKIYSRGRRRYPRRASGIV